MGLTCIPHNIQVYIPHIQTECEEYPDNILYSISSSIDHCYGFGYYYVYLQIMYYIIVLCKYTKKSKTYNTSLQLLIINNIYKQLGRRETTHMNMLINNFLLANHKSLAHTMTKIVLRMNEKTNLLNLCATRWMEPIVWDHHIQSYH